MKTSKLMTHCGKTTRAWLALACLATGLALPAPAGVLLRLGYGLLGGTDAIPGVNVSDLTSNAAFPNSPDTYDVLTSGLQIPMNIANDYGSWVRGFIEAPQTGQYTFWLAAVDSGQFWLSPSTDPAGKVLVAQNGLIGWMGPNDWFLSASQQS